MEHRLPPTKLTLTLTLILTLNPKPYQALESLDWVERVERRWELRQHSPYAHLAQDGRLAASDALVDLSFVGPASALATVQLGFPPLMYTEVLSLLRVRPDAAGGGAEPRWMVVASSCCAGVPYLVQESIPIAEATLHTMPMPPAEPVRVRVRVRGTGTGRVDRAG